MIANTLNWLREDLRDFMPYPSARKTAGTQGTLLNANESPFSNWQDQQNINRYPEPQPAALKQRLAQLYGVQPQQLLITRGSDEAIDLLVRVCCQANRDSIVVSSPTFGFYAVAAALQGVSVKDIPWQLQSNQWLWPLDRIVDGIDSRSRLLFVCSPNNPTGQQVSHAQLLACLRALDPAVLVVVDEAYVEFSPQGSAAQFIDDWPNLVVLRTLSKAHGLAGARIGALLAQATVIDVLKGLLAPYPIPTPCSELALRALSAPALMRTRQQIALLVQERCRVAKALESLSKVQSVYPSDGNFLLVRFENPDAIEKTLEQSGIKVRRPSPHPLLVGCLRISVGTAEENDCLLAALGAESSTRTTPTYRQTMVERATKETTIQVCLNLDGEGHSDVQTGIGFFDHLLAQLAKHAAIDLSLHCIGDLHIDEHHSVEDCALAIGQALRLALGDKCGIARYGCSTDETALTSSMPALQGSFALPMDETLAMAALDCSDRPVLVWDGTFQRERVGELSAEMIPHFFRTLCEAAGMNLHLRLRGDNAHHMAEAAFKVFARALRQAILRGARGVPSTKGRL